MDQSRIWLLLARKISGEATLDELRELEMLLKDDPALRYYASLMKEMTLKTPDPVTAVEEALEKHMKLIQSPAIQAKRPKRVLFRSLAVAASILAAGVAIWGIWSGSGQRYPGRELLSSEVSTRHGSRSKITLPDSSIVWLNVGSKLNYDYGKADSREVVLEGEAFFDVQKDENRPFLIHTRKMDITVLGTTFNVRSYMDDKTVETSLIQGKVEVTIKGDKPEKIILAPNQKIVLPNQERTAAAPANTAAAGKEQYTLSEVRINPRDSLVLETAWKENYLIFNNERFEDIAIKMERWFDVHIIFQDSAVKNYRFTGTFANETVEQTLDALQFSSMFHYHIDKKQVIIKR
jgi:ferric-dicitrate binding protein FerR (iron transport regulator)